MSRIICIVCGDYWHPQTVLHGGMARWEARLFLQGAGCPSCHGKDKRRTEIERLADLTLLRQQFLDVRLGNPGPRGMEDIRDLLAGKEAPPWVEPKPEVMWTCEGCEVRAETVPDTDMPKGDLDRPYNGDYEWKGGAKVHYHHGMSLSGSAALDRQGEPAPEQEPHHQIGGRPYCPLCSGECADCEAPILIRSGLVGDTHQAGASFLTDESWNGRLLCYDCYVDQLFPEEWEEWEGEE